MTARLYPDVNTSEASNNPANKPAHRQGQDVNSVDQLSSVVLMGLAIAGGAAAILFIHLLV